jgi:hypothetical protein
MKIMPLALALAAAASVPAHAAERRYSVTDFDRVQVDGPYEVTLATGGSSSAVATGDSGGLERVSVEVQGRVLRIRPNRSGWGGYPGDTPGPVRIALTTRDLRGASVIGSGRLAVDRARGLKIELSVSGSGALSVGSVAADTLLVGLVGSGQVELAGTAKQLRATIQGSGDLAAAGLTTDDAQLTADTSGSIALQAVRTAKVAALGRGSVQIGGAASCTLTGAAAGLVRCGR